MLVDHYSSYKCHRTHRKCCEGPHLYKYVSQVFIGLHQVQSPHQVLSSSAKHLHLHTMFQLRRMNALTPAQAIVMAKLAREEPVSPKSLEILNAALNS